MGGIERFKIYSRIDWENEPSIKSPINAVNLNRMDYALDELDNRVLVLDETKTEKQDALLLLKEVAYDEDTGVFVFTKMNGTTYTVDLNIEKIPVSFSMSAAGVITMITDDGTEYTADVGELIKVYTFVDSNEVRFEVTTDEHGNKTIKSHIVDGSITESMLQPQF